MFKGKKALAMSVLCAVASVGFVMGASAEDAMHGELDEIVVEGSRDTLPGGLVSKSGVVGIMGNKDVMDVPFQQTNIAEGAIERFGADPSQASTAILVNVPSIRTSSSTIYNDFSIRGQAANSYQFRVNGVPGVFSQNNLPMNFFEGVEVISGASVGVYGTAAKESAGGSINLRTKRAGAEDLTRYTVTFAGASSWGNYLDVSRRFGDKKQFGLRINASHVDGETSIDDENVKQKTFSINFDAHGKMSDTNLFVGYRDSKVYDSLRYFDFSNKNITKLPSAPKASNNYSFKGSNLGMETTFFTLNHVQKLSDDTQIFLNGGYSYNNGYDYLVTSSSRFNVINNAGDYTSYIQNEPYCVKNGYFQLGVKQKWTAGDVKNEFALSWDKNWYRGQWGATANPRGTVSGNLYNGHTIYDFISTNNGKALPGSTQQYYGWTAVNTSEIGKASITLGLHRHTASDTSSTGKNTQSSATSPLYGVVYRPDNNFALFANHTESFQQGSAVGAGYLNTGSILDPAKTKSNEVGVKYTNGNAYASLSYFDMKMANAMDKYVSDNDKVRTLDGENTFRGIELGFGGKLADKWTAQGGLMYLDSEYSNTADNYLRGKQVKGVAKFSGVANLAYAPQDDLSLWGRMIYTSSAPLYTNGNNELTVPSFTTFDFGATYKTKISNTPVTFSATLFNAFNKDYWMARPTYNYGILGNPRTLFLSAQFDL